MVLTQDEAQRLGHNFIAPDHVALGLLRNDVEAEVGSPGRGRRRGRRGAETQGGLFAALELDAGALRQELEDSAEQVHRAVQKIGGFPPDLPRRGPFTESTKAVLEMALRQALSLGHNTIGPGHILLGLLRKGEPEPLIHKIEYEAAKRRVIQWLGADESGQRPWPSPYQRWGASSTPSRGFRHVAEVAVAEAERAGELPGSQHLLMVMAAAEGTLAHYVLHALGVTEEKVRELIDSLGTEGTSDEPPENRVEVRLGDRTVMVTKSSLSEAVSILREKDPRGAADLAALLGGGEADADA